MLLLINKPYRNAHGKYLHSLFVTFAESQKYIIEKEEKFSNYHIYLNIKQLSFTTFSFHENTHTQHA